jgi:tRNA(Ile)-lysidine synthase
MGEKPSESFHARLDALAPQGDLGVAVSGGGDSVALLLMATEWASRTGRRVEAATVDHRLRPESGAEAEAVASLCDRLGVSHEILTWCAPPDAGNLSAAAREARIALLGDWARRRGLAFVALGHTLDDQAETVLLRLARGAGVDGLSGMAARVRRDGVVWIRPLLDARRDDLREYLRDAGAAWAEDPSNDDDAYARIRMRRLIADSADFSAEGLAAAADRLRDQRAALEWLATEFADRALRWGVLGEAWLDLAALAPAPEDTRLRVAGGALREISGAAYRPRQSALAPLLAELMEAESGSRTLHGCLVAWAHGAAAICREPSAASEEIEATENALWDRRWRIRPGVEGARIARLGEAGEAALAALRKCGAWEAPEDWRAAPRAARLASPALWRDGTLIAAPLAGYGPARATLAPTADAWRPSRRDDPFHDR